jgi:hypothetical protein
MSPVEQLYPVIALVAAISAAITAAAGGVRWLTKHYFDQIKAELTSNGGSSIKDKVDNLESEHERLFAKIEDIEKKADKDHNELSGKIDNLYNKIIDLLSK